MKVKIYKPIKSAMQSGRAKNRWLVEISEEEARKALGREAAPANKEAA